jgi:hypothetical protein
MASNDNSPHPSKEALLYASLFGLVAIVLPWMSFDGALNALLIGTALVLPWAAWDSVRRAREQSHRALHVAGFALLAATELIVAVASATQLAANMRWLPPVG